MYAANKQYKGYYQFHQEMTFTYALESDALGQNSPIQLFKSIQPNLYLSKLKENSDSAENFLGLVAPPRSPTQYFSDMAA